MRQVTISTCSHTDHCGWATRGNRASTDATGTATVQRQWQWQWQWQCCKCALLFDFVVDFGFSGDNTKIIPRPTACLQCRPTLLHCGLWPIPHPYQSSHPRQSPSLIIILTLSHIYPPPLSLSPTLSLSPPLSQSQSPPPPPNPHPNPHLSA